MIQLLAGDCRDVLATLPAERVQCVVTSPPYYALRSYGVGAEHGEIGSEPTPDEYLATMVAVFREVRRVLRRDGTLWLNIGDSYASPIGGNNIGLRTAQFGAGNEYGKKVDELEQTRAASASRKGAYGLQAKQLLMMPARLALALQADGWWVRSDIIWHKPNPMPESCTDRPTSAHEHVFLLTRSARYYYDSDGVREEAFSGSTSPFRGASYVNQGAAPSNSTHRGVVTQGAMDTTSRNLRNVWTIATHPYAQAHFATYPPALAERCIRAGTSERGACSQCGKAWVRVVERTAASVLSPASDYGNGAGRNDGGRSQLVGAGAVTTGWSPACACNAGDPVPCVVLDPFAGAGTTLLVADRLQRDAIGIELNPSYTEMAMQRCRDDAPLFTAFPPADDPEETRMADLFANLAAD